jgi:hypothetical protein
VKDASYGAVTFGSALGCYTVTALCALKRMKHRRVLQVRPG